MSSSPAQPAGTPTPENSGAAKAPRGAAKNPPSTPQDARSTPQQPAAKPRATRPAGELNTTGWLSLLVAVGLLALQIYYAVNATSIDSDGNSTVRSVITFGSLILGLAGAVLGMVGLAQRRTPVWPSVVGTSIGIYAFVIAVFSWIGGLMNA